MTWKIPERYSQVTKLTWRYSDDRDADSNSDKTATVFIGRHSRWLKLSELLNAYRSSGDFCDVYFKLLRLHRQNGRGHFSEAVYYVVY